MARRWDIALAVGLAIVGGGALFVTGEPPSPRLSSYRFEPPRVTAFDARKDCAPAAAGAGRQAVEAARTCLRDATARNEEHRLATNDLIQQTRAADAAAAQALSAWHANRLALLQTIGGYLTLIAAAAAAIYARSAANEARRTADLARDQLQDGRRVSELQLRAYFDLTAVTLTSSQDQQFAPSLGYHLVFRFENLGETPARAIQTRWSYQFGQDQPTIADDDPWTHCAMTVRNDSYNEKTLIEVRARDVQSVNERRGELRIAGEYLYEDAFGHRYHRTFAMRSPDLAEVFWDVGPETVQDVAAA